MLLGILVGTLLHAFWPLPDAGGSERIPAIHQYLTNGLFAFVGRVFLNLLLLLVVPVVFVSLVCGTASLENVRQLGRLGVKTLILYLATTAIAISLALAAAVAFKPGAGFNRETDAAYVASGAPHILDTLVNVVPSNPVQALAEANMLQIIVFSVLFGVALNLAGSAGKRIISLFDDLNVVVMKLVDIVMWVAPYGVFALIARTFASHGYGSVGPLLGYFSIVLGVLILHAGLTYPILLSLLGRLNPVHFIRKMYPVQMFAFGTASSNATIPLNLENVETRLGVKGSVASFTIPLGATLNMDGTAIMQGVATAFIAQAYNVDMTFAGYATVVAMATIASIGTAGVPGVGLVMLAMVLRQVNLPVEGIALIIGIDRLLDMARTAVNITGDAAVTCVVAKSEGAFDEAVYSGNQPLTTTPRS